MRREKSLQSKWCSGSVEPLLILFVFCVAAGSVAGYLVQKTVGPDSHAELNEYLHQYVDYCANETHTAVSFVRILLVYLRYPVAAFCLGFCAVGVYLLPVLCMVQGFFLSFSVCCFTSALGHTGVYLAFAAFGLRALITLPCLMLLAIQAFCRARSMREMLHKRNGKACRPDSTYFILPAICTVVLLLGAVLDIILLPPLFQWAFTKLM